MSIQETRGGDSGSFLVRYQMHRIPLRHLPVLFLVFAAAALAAGCSSGGSSNSGGGALQPPSNVTATPGLGQVTITWSPVVGATSYNIYWDVNPGVTRAAVNQFAGAVSPFDHTGLTPGTTYYYVVTSLRGATEGVESTEVSAMPGSPTPPGNVTATGGDGSVTITFSAVPAATSYNLYWATSPGVSKATGTPITGVTSPFLHTSLTNGTTYHYVLTTVQGALEGLESSEVSAVPARVLLGSLDPTFGAGGVVTHDNAGGGGGLDKGREVAIDGLGRIVIVGFSRSPANGFDLVIWRLNDDGSLDTTFNGQGWVTHDSAAGGNSDDIGVALTLDGAGRILATGTSLSVTPTQDMAVWRFNDDGSLDTTFAAAGIIHRWNTAGGTPQDQAWDIALDSQDRIVVPGWSRGSGTGLDMVLWRFDPNGATDTTFGSGGVFIHHNAAGGDKDDLARSVAIDGSDGIFAVGQSTGAVGGSDNMVIWKVDASGTLDPSYGTGGIVTFSQPGTSFGEAARLDSLGRVVATGHSSDDLAIWRYDAAGLPDPGFAAAGLFIHDSAAGGFNTDLGYDLVLDPAGNVYACGYSVNINVNLDMAVWAVDDTGVLLPAFGSGGFIAHHDAAGGGGDDSAWGLALDSAGRIVATGDSLGAGFASDMAVWRIE